MRRTLLAALAALAVGVGLGAPAQAVPTVGSCYERVGMTDVDAPEIESELYVLIDQTVEFDADLRQHVATKIMAYMRPGGRLILTSFSAHVDGRYNKIALIGQVDRNLSEDHRFSIPQRDLRKLDHCLRSQRAVLAEVIPAKLRGIFENSSSDLPRTEILANLVRMGEDVIPRTRVSEDVHLLVVSDMMQNSEVLSLYRSGRLRDLDIDGALSEVDAAGFMGTLEGVSVSVVGAGASLNSFRPTDRRSLKRFWRQYVSQSGGNLREFGAPEMSGSIAP